MDYELAKQLKDAAFTQVYHYDDQGRRTDFREPEVVALPALSELIEACKPLILRVGGASTASFGSFVATGTTPEEAVARLWLALNKK